MMFQLKTKMIKLVQRKTKSPKGDIFLLFLFLLRSIPLAGTVLFLLHLKESRSFQLTVPRCSPGKRQHRFCLDGSGLVLWGIKNIVDHQDATTEITRVEATTGNSSTRNTLEQSHRVNDNIRSYDLRNPVFSDETYSGSLPFSLVVDQVAIKQALILAASNPRGLGASGVILYGGKGTAKSVLARSVQHLLPRTIRRIKGSIYNIDPEGSDIIDSLLEKKLKETNQTLLDLDVEAIKTPFQTIPVSCQEDSLLGTVDLEKSLVSGSTVFEPGLLAKAHRGILYIDDINLLDEGLVHILMNALSDGYVLVEREGLSVRYPCRPAIVLASFNPEEGEMREHWVDRMAMAVPAGIDELSVPERVEVVQNVEGYLDKTLPMERALKEDKDIKESILAAQELLPKVEISKKQLLYLCDEATRAECVGQRAEIFATEIAKTSAALVGRTKVNAQDLQRAVILAIAPRSQVFTSPDPWQDLAPPPPPLPDLIPPEQNETIQDEDIDAEEEDQAEQEEKEDEIQEEPNPDDDDFQIPTTFMFGVEKVPIDPRLMKFHKATRKGKGGKQSKMFNLIRGRFVKAVFPKGNDWKKGHIAIGATLRAAAPFQIARRKYSTDNQKKLIYIRDSDFRIKKMSRKAGSLILFVVDASGSMALNRMGAAKGAAIALLQEAYKSRDKICLIEFHGSHAETIVPPTKSSTMTKRRLEGMPCGGESPLAHALVTAIRTGLNALKVKKDIGRVVVVLFTDGRGNVPLCVSEGEDFDTHHFDPRSVVDGKPSRVYLHDEVMTIAKQLGALNDFNVLVIDTEDKFIGTGMGQELAKVARGNYYHLMTLDARNVEAITRQEIKNTGML